MARQRFDATTELRIRELLGQLRCLMHEHGPRGEPVRQLILSQRGQPVGDFERLAFTVILIFEARPALN